MRMGGLMMIWRPNSAVEGGIHDLRARACSAARSDRKPASHPDHGRHAEVEEKRKRLRKQKPRKIGAFIGHHMIPVVLGPKKRHYVTKIRFGNIGYEGRQGQAVK